MEENRSLRHFPLANMGQRASYPIAANKLHTTEQKQAIHTSRSHESNKFLHLTEFLQLQKCLTFCIYPSFLPMLLSVALNLVCFTTVTSEDQFVYSGFSGNNFTLDGTATVTRRCP